MTEVFNRKAEKEKRRILRNEATKAEKIIWDRIRNKKINGKKFRRQVSIGPYIVDFYSPELKLIIEIDGDTHNTSDAKEYDEYRDSYMNSLGLNIVRYTNYEVFNNIDKLINEIKKIC